MSVVLWLAYLVLWVFGAGVGIVALIASRCVLPYEWMLLIYILVVVLWLVVLRLAPVVLFWGWCCVRGFGWCCVVGFGDG